MTLQIHFNNFGILSAVKWIWWTGDYASGSSFINWLFPNAFPVTPLYIKGSEVLGRKRFAVTHQMDDEFTNEHDHREEALVTFQAPVVVCLTVGLFSWKDWWGVV